MIEVILFIGMWWTIGTAIAVHQWTRDFDLETMDAVICLMVGALGPTLVVVPVGRWLFERYDLDRILMKRRRK